MDLAIVAVYTICKDFLISCGHQEHPPAKMSNAEVMTTALVAARYFGGNQQTVCTALKILEYIPNMFGHSRYNRRLHRGSAKFQTLFEHFAKIAKADNPNQIYSIDTYPVAACDNIRISRSQLYKDQAWRGKILSKQCYFYEIKAHLMVTETGYIVNTCFTPGHFSDVRDLRCYRFDLSPGLVVYADKAYCDYGMKGALQAAEITLKPLRKKKLKASISAMGILSATHIS